SVHLRGQHDLVARRVVDQGLAHDLLAAADRVHVRGVEEVDPGIQGVLEHWAGVLLLENPLVDPALRVAEAHRAQAQARHVQPGAAQLHVLHEVLLLLQWCGRSSPSRTILVHPAWKREDLSGHLSRRLPTWALPHRGDRREVPGTWYLSTINSRHHATPGITQPATSPTSSRFCSSRVEQNLEKFSAGQRHLRKVLPPGMP